MGGVDIAVREIPALSTSKRYIHNVM